ncbi:MAG: HAD-IC family P-type ATPase [Clostridia bacterium]|nr:HAD-IC family P-type ATPase [Clostridia bacterium]
MEKKTTKKTTTSSAPKKRAPRLVTKDTNESGKIKNTVVDPLSVIESAPPVIDKSVFDDETEPLALDTAPVKSVTIDGSMLSRDRLTKNRSTTLKTKRKKILASDISLATRFSPDPERGLDKEQLARREADGFVNIAPKKNSKTYKSIFFSNIFTFFNLLTFIVAAALIAVKSYGNLFFLAIITCNIVIGIFLEIRAKRKIDKLSLMSAPTAMVVRGGEKQAIPVGEVVLDDIIYLETGKQICSDSIVVKGECEVNEAMLTGESVPMKKTAGSELYAGSFVTSGNCYARVDKVGGANYVQTLTSYAKRYKKPKSEIQNSIRMIIRIISVFIIPITALWLYRMFAIFGGDWEKMINYTAGMVIGMLPTGMFLLTSVALAMSVLRLSKQKTLVQDLYCIEMLARVDVLCLDKTGTITDGSMQVNNIIEIKGGPSDVPISEAIGSLLTATGDNNQTALALANRFGYSQALKPMKVIPFSSRRKLSAVTFEGAGTYMLGAPEFVLRDMGVRIEKIIAENAANGYRVLVLAHSPAEIQGDRLPAVRRPVCLIVIEDHIREDAVRTIKWFKDNDVAVKVISGDNPITVSEVAKRVGVDNAELYISLEGLSNQEVVEAANKYTVFGRVTPEQKSLLVKSIKAVGHTVAMTGDGVNDIMAMREADCSVAMASGAEAATNVSHLVLLDNNFTSMPSVVQEGRRVINNIQKSSSLFLMKTFMSIALSLIYLILSFTSGEGYPFEPKNLMLIEIFVIAVPSFFLAMQSNKKRIQGKFIANVISRCLPGGIALVLTVMSVYVFSCFVPEVLAAGAVTALTPELVTSMMVIAVTFTGWMALCKMCEPFDGYRIVVAIVSGALIVTALIVLPSLFGVGELPLMCVLFVLTVVLASYFVVSILMKILGKINTFSMTDEVDHEPEIALPEKTAVPVQVDEQ